MALQDVTQITINLSATPSPVAGFATVLIAGVNAPVAAIPEGETKEYFDMDEMDADLWAGTEDEYKAANDAFSNDAYSVKIAHLTAFTIQVQNITITGADDGTYEIDVDDTLGNTFTAQFTASTSTITNIRDDLLTDLQGSDFETGGLITFASVSTDGISATADAAGYGFTLAEGGTQSANISIVNTTPNVGYAEELSDLILFDDDWYGLVGVDDDSFHIAERANWVESRYKIHIARTSEAAVKAAGSTDVASMLMASGYQRTGLIYHETANDFVDAAWAAKVLAVDADSESTTWDGKDLSSITKQSFTGAEQGYIEGKNCNYFNVFRVTKGVTYKGQACSGDWLDLILAADWLKIRGSEDLQDMWYEQSNLGKKVPYNNRGISLTQNRIMSRVRQGITAGHLDEGTPGSDTNPVPTFDFPSRAESASADVTNRIYRFSGTVSAAGAIINFVGDITLLG